MANEPQNSGEINDEQPIEQASVESLNLEAGLAAAYGKQAKQDSNPDRSPSFYRPGETIAGRFRLIECIGEGGMGTVWYAEQTSPVKRKVALKLIKPGLDSRTVLARFEAERQALALMEHPNIAKVFDGGVTDLGHPFFAMELVRGTSLTVFCDDRRVALSERIKLFITVCEAIQHAHQKGVIHRDIKPSNIMVALYDGNPVPKVIDFGVAKAIGPALTDESLHTEFGAVVGTAEYMSPEQAQLNNLDIDTRSDVYSLGVLMYELLAGSTPFSRAELTVQGMHEILRVIREVDPQRPSAKLSTSKRRASIAALRGIEPDALGRMLQSDLDWIVMKSLEKERSRRYESPHAMARDLERYLRDEPIEARPPSTAYRIGKLWRRYRWQTIGAGLFVATLIAGIIGTSLGVYYAESQRRVAVQAQQAADDRAAGETRAKQDALRQKEIAEKAEDATLESYRASADDAIEKLIISKTALSNYERSYLDGALKRWQSFADRQGNDERSRAISAEAHFRVATIWDVLGEHERAIEEYERAAELWDRLGNDFPEKGQYRSESSRSSRNQSLILRSGNSNIPEAEALLRSAITNQEKLVEKFSANAKFRQELLLEYVSLGMLMGMMSKSDEAVSIIGRAVQSQQAIVDQFPDDIEFRHSLAGMRLNYSVWLRKIGNAEEEAQLRLALEDFEQLVASAPAKLNYRVGLANCLGKLGSQLAISGSHVEAERLLRRSVVTLQALVTEFPSAPELRGTLALSHQQLGYILLDLLSKTLEAELEYRKATEIRERLVADFPNVPQYRSGLATSYFTLGYILSVQGKVAEARTEYQKALVIEEEKVASSPTVPDNKTDLAWVYHNLGRLDLDNGNAAESVAWFDKSITLGRDVFDAHPELVDVRRLLQDNYRFRAKAREKLNIEGHQQDFNQALELFPDDASPEVRVLKAITLGEAKRYALMVAEIEALILLDSSPTGSHIWTPVHWYDFASMLSEASENLPDRRQELADRGMEYLKKSIENGFQDLDFIKQDTSLNAIRDRQEFGEIIEKLEQVKKTQR